MTRVYFIQYNTKNTTDVHIKRDLFCFLFQKSEKKNLKKDNFIQHKNKAGIQHKTYTTKKIQHKVGVLGAGL